MTTDLSARERKVVDLGAVRVEYHVQGRGTIVVLPPSLGRGTELLNLDFRFGKLDWGAHHPRAAKWFETFDARVSMRETRPHEER